MIHTTINHNYKHETKVTLYHNTLYCIPAAIKALLLYQDDALCEFKTYKTTVKTMQQISKCIHWTRTGIL